MPHPIQGRAGHSNEAFCFSVTLLSCEQKFNMGNGFQYQNEKFLVDIFRLGSINTLHIGCFRLVAQEKLQMVEVV